MTVIGGPRLSTIPPTFFNDYSFEFDGTDDYVVTQTSVNGTDFTLSYWVNANGSYANFQRFHPVSIRPSNNTANQSIGYLYTKGATLYPSYQAYDSTDTIYSTWSARDLDFIGAGWHNIIWTFNVTTREIYLYVDGVAQTFTSYDGLNTTSYLIGSRITNIITYSNINIGATWVPTEYWDGDVDEVSTYDRILTPSDINTIYGTGIPNDISSLNPKAWYRMGDNSLYKDPQWLLPSNENKDKFSNYSMSFDGTNDYIDCGNILNFDYINAFSFSAWIKYSHDVASNTIIGKQETSGNFRGYDWFVTSDHKLRFFLYSTTTNRLDQRGTTVLTTDTWYHVVVTYNGGGAYTDVKMYINGNLETLNKLGNNNITATSLNSIPFQIGARGNGSDVFNGNIDDISIWDKELLSSEVSTIWNNGIPKDESGTPNLIGYWRMSENATFKDPQWLLPNNENKDKISNYSMSFDGTDDWVNCGRDSSLDFNNAITISAWIKTDVTAGTTVMPILFKDGTGGTSRCYSLGFRPLSAGYDKAYIGIFHTNGNNTTVYTSTAGALSNGNWHHLMGTYDGTDNTDALKIYVDGVLDNTATPTPGDTGIHIKTNVDVAIGSLSHGTSWWWEGGIDGVAVWGTDQSSNISFIYSGGTGGTPPDLSSLNPISYWKMGDDSTFSTNWTVPDQIGGNDGTSANMDINDRVGDAPSSSGNTVSFNMDINDRIGDAPSSENNALSYNMVLSGRTTDVPT